MADAASQPEGSASVGSDGSSIRRLERARHVLSRVRRALLHNPEESQMLEAIHPEDRPMVDAAYKESVASRTPYTVQHRLLLPDGRIKHVVEKGRTMYGDDGKARRSIGTVQDVTERVVAEQARLDLVAKEAEVGRLEQENRMRMEFLNAAAHDLNTPLTILRLQLDLMRRKPDPHHVETMDKAISRMGVLIQDLLDAARLQAGRLKLQPQDLPIQGILEDAASMFVDQAKDAGLDCASTDVDPGIRVHADPDKVMQVLFNLLNNAIKFTPRGGHVRLEARTEGAHCRVQIEDDGLGFTAQQKEALFLPFSRPHEGMEGVAKGTGLGLYISKGIVERHGGTMDCDSPGPGKGARFWFTLPLAAKTGTRNGSKGKERKRKGAQA